MLLYSKLYEFLTQCGCKIGELLGKDGILRYVKFQTKQGTPCLLYISSRHEMKCDSKQLTPLTKWSSKKSTGFESILTLDPTIPLIKEIFAESSPEGYINFLKRLSHSMGSIPYRAGILSKEYLTILHKDNEVDTYYVKGPSEAQLVVVIDLETVLGKHVIPEVDRVYSNLLVLLDETQQKYWDSLLHLLDKCSKLKIITEGKKHTLNPIERNISTFLSQNALKAAIECCFEYNEKK